MQLKVGDKVRPLDETGGGHVTRVLDNGQVMVSMDDFEFAYYPHQLVVIPDEGPSRAGGIAPTSPPVKEMNRIILEKESSDRPKPLKRGAINEQGIREIDLHLHHLVDHSRGMTNGDKLMIQLEHCRQAIESAIRQKEPKIVLIHGVGEGVLKSEIRRMLADYPNLEYHDASYRRYGYGATEVIFH